MGQIFGSNIKVEGSVGVGALGAGNARIFAGVGDPEGVVNADVGSIFLRTDGAAGTTLFTKESDPGGPTGWAAVGGAPAATALGARVFMSVNLAVANNAATAVGFNSESFDQGTLHDNAVNNSRLTVPAGEAGRWIIQTHPAWALSGIGIRQLAIRKNGTDLMFNTLNADTMAGFAGAGNELTADSDMSIVAILDDAAAADFYEMIVYQDSGAARNLLGGATKTWFAMARVN